MIGKFDVAVIGGGPGGYVAAIKAAQLGKKCAIIEKENLGGVCLNWGCIPTKSLLRNAEVLSSIYEGEKFGFSVDTNSIVPDYSKAYKRSREVSAQLVKGVEYLMNKNNIKVFKDEAVFTAPKKLGLKESGSEILADNVIIATGSRPNRIKGFDFDSEYILDSRKALQLKKAPKNIIIIGAGAIGMEFATIWKAFGAQVTVVEMMEHVLPNEDPDISKEAAKQFENKGIGIITGTRVVEVKAGKEGVEVTLSSEGRKLKSEYLLVSAGITPNTNGIGIEKTGVKLNERGYIGIDKSMRTNISGLYAIGDVTGKLTLAHVASAQGIIAAKTIAGVVTESIVYENIPKCAYCNPETASAGLTEKQAKERGIECVAGVFPFSANGKAISYGSTEGFVKVIAGKKYKEIIGVHMVGHHVTEMISAAVGYLSQEYTLDELENLIHPHPTLSEAVMEAAHVAAGKGIHI